MKTKTVSGFFFAIALVILSSFNAQAQKEIKTIEIKSSTVCEMCKATIEKNLSFEKGVKETVVDLKTNTVIVKYREDKTTPEKIKAAIIKLGYSADGVPGDEKAFQKLPKCCQKEGCGKQ